MERAHRKYNEMKQSELKQYVLTMSQRGPDVEKSKKSLIPLFPIPRSTARTPGEDHPACCEAGTRQKLRAGSATRKLGQEQRAPQKHPAPDAETEAAFSPRIGRDIPVVASFAGDSLQHTASCSTVTKSEQHMQTRHISLRMYLGTS
jgi:hypothetical protein